MNKFIVKIVFVLVLTFPFLVFSGQVQAQTAASTLDGLCITPNEGSLAYPSDRSADDPGNTSRCFFPFEFNPINNLTTDFKFVCTFQAVSNSTYSVSYANIATDGKSYNCKTLEDQNLAQGGNYIKNIQLVSRSAVSGAPVITPPTIDPPKPNDPKVPPTPNPTPTPTSTPNTPITQGNQVCDPGFTKIGPLCVPESPITNKDSIANSGSIGELATRIIRILLFFSGIVAVIFVIIGGYQIMTAQGNETQSLNGRKTLTNALIGLVIIILSYAIVQAVVTFIIK